MPPHLRRGCAVRAAAILAAMALATPVHAGIQRIPHGNESPVYGNWFQPLPNGNVVVADPGYDVPGGAQNVGAVSLFASDGRLIQRTVGQQAGDALGWYGIALLSNGHYVVSSPQWGSPGMARRGAVTWGHAERGLPEVISPTNSLVGDSTGDSVGFGGVLALPNGHYVVLSLDWRGVGAATWSRGDGSTVGPVSAANSLVGSRTYDFLEERTEVLPDSTVLLLLNQWDNGSTRNAGAVVWLRGDAPTTGTIGPANALVGSTTDDFRNAYLFPVPGGRVAFAAPYWDAPGKVDAGAVLVASGSARRTGPVSEQNAWVGAAAGDLLGLGISHPDYRGIVPLANGELAVLSPTWGGRRGAVHRIPNAPEFVGVSSLDNAVVGRYADEYVGNGGVVPTPEGGLVVVSPEAWSQPSLRRAAGAITVVPPGFGRTVLDASNSWFGIAAEDRWGSGGVLRLSDGRWLVGSGWIDHQGLVDAGGVGVVSGTAGTGGIVDAATLWFGNQANARFGEVDRFGRDAAWAALPNGEALVPVDAYRLSGATRAGVLHVHNDTPRGVLRPENVVAMPGTPVATLALANGRFAAVFSGGIAFDEGGRLPADVDTAPGRRWSPQAGGAFFRALALSNGRIAVLADATGQDGRMTMTLSTLGPDQPTGTLGPTNSATNLPLCYPHLAEMPGGRFTLFSASQFAMGCSLGSYVLASTSSRLLAGARDWEVADGDIVGYDADYPPLPHFDAVAGRLTHGDRGAVVRMSLDGGDRPPTWRRAPAITPELLPRSWSALIADAEAVDADGDPITYTYQWRRNGESIAGANGPRHVLTMADRGAALSVRVSASAGGQTITAEPWVSVPANQLPDRPSLAIQGRAEPGQTLSAALGPLGDPDGDAVSVSYAWTTAPGPALGTGASYLVREADVDRRLTLTVTISDGRDSVTVSQDVFVNPPSPVATDDRFVVDGPEFFIPAPGVLGNDLHVPPANQRSLVIVSRRGDDTALELTLGTDGSLRGHAGRNTDGTAVVRYRLCRTTGSMACAEAEATLERRSRVLAVDDALRVRIDAPSVLLSPLANDLLPADAPTASITLLGNTAGARASVEGLRVRFVPDSDPTRVDLLHYRVCVAASRCSEAAMEVRNSPGAITEPSMRWDRGRTDVGTIIRPGGLRAHVAAFPPVAALPVSGAVRHAARDADPMGLAVDERLLSFHELAPAGAPRRFLVSGASPFVVGLDRNRNGRADREERLCAGRDFRPTLFDPADVVGGWCEIDGAAESRTADRFWVLAYSHRPLQGYSVETTLVAVDIHAVALEEGAGFSAWRTERSYLPNRSFLAMSWDRSDLWRLHHAVGFLRFQRMDGTSEWWPYRVSHMGGGSGASEPVAVAPGTRAMLPVYMPHTVSEMTHFVDVPPGARRLRFVPTGTTPAELRAARVALPTGSPSSPRVARGPAAADATHRSGSASGAAPLEIENPAAGRWYFAATSNTGEIGFVDTAVDLEATAPTLRPGSYFNPDRSGHGLFVYPAADQWAALWYAYTGGEAGDATWYYAQAAAPTGNGVWRAPLFRSTWFGGRNHLAPAGHLTLTAAANDRITFTYTIEGITGSETLSAFGRGCPRIAGRTLDKSGHWFNPARSGTGYSVQLLPDYEFYVAFGYDASGDADFRIAEGPRVDAREARFDVAELTGFCPLCERRTAPERQTTGRFTRTINDDGTMRFQAVPAPGQPTGGTWTFDEPVQPLGGLQGCAP